MTRDKREVLKAEVIIKVRCGQLKATEAAAILGVSRKTYYEWESRGLKGFMEALKEKQPGRPAVERDLEKEQANNRISELEKELASQKAKLQISRSLLENSGQGKKN